MKHGTFLFILALLVLVSGCRARKNIVRKTETTTAVERVEVKTDTSRTTTTVVTSVDAKDSLRETTERETIHLDTLGRIRTIIRESVRKEAGSGRTYRGQGTIVSVTGKTDSVSSVETLHATSQEITETKTDSRPVQGAEWLWVMLGSIIAIGVIILFIKKVK